eukprot:5740325-Pyramimonas_sp.AAC.1
MATWLPPARHTIPAPRLSTSFSRRVECDIFCCKDRVISRLTCGASRWRSGRGIASNRESPLLAAIDRPLADSFVRRDGDFHCGRRRRRDLCALCGGDDGARSAG